MRIKQQHHLLSGAPAPSKLLLLVLLAEPKLAAGCQVKPFKFELELEPSGSHSGVLEKTIDFKLTTTVAPTDSVSLDVSDLLSARSVCAEQTNH